MLIDGDEVIVSLPASIYVYFIVSLLVLKAVDQPLHIPADGEEEQLPHDANECGQILNKIRLFFF